MTKNEKDAIERDKEFWRNYADHSAKELLRSNGALTNKLIELQRDIAARDERIRELEQQHPCTCGSGAHPRHCKQHPQGFDLHVARLNYETAQETIAELEQQLKAAQECCVQHDTVVQEIVDAKVVWATEDTPFTGPEVLELLQENELLRARGKAAQERLAEAERLLRIWMDEDAPWLAEEYFAKHSNRGEG